MENGPFIDGLPIKNGDFPSEGKSSGNRSCSLPSTSCCGLLVGLSENRVPENPMLYHPLIPIDSPRGLRNALFSVKVAISHISVGYPMKKYHDIPFISYCTLW